MCLWFNTRIHLPCHSMVSPKTVRIAPCPAGRSVFCETDFSIQQLVQKPEFSTRVVAKNLYQPVMLRL